MKFKLPDLNDIWKEIEATEKARKILPGLDNYFKGASQPGTKILARRNSLFSFNLPKKNPNEEREELLRAELFSVREEMLALFKKAEFYESKGFPLRNSEVHPAMKKAVSFIKELLDSGLFYRLARNFSEFEKLLERDLTLVVEMSQLLMLAQKYQASFNTAHDFMAEQKSQLKAKGKPTAELEYNVEKTEALLTELILQIKITYNIVNKIMALCNDNLSSASGQSGPSPLEFKKADSMTFLQAAPRIMSLDIIEFANQRIAGLEQKPSKDARDKIDFWKRVIAKAPELNKCQSLLQLSTAFEKAGCFFFDITTVPNNELLDLKSFFNKKLEKYTMRQRAHTGVLLDVRMDLSPTSMDKSESEKSEFEEYSKRTVKTLESHLKIIEAATKGFSSPLRRNAAQLHEELADHLKRRNSATL